MGRGVRMGADASRAWSLSVTGAIGEAPVSTHQVRASGIYDETHHFFKKENNVSLWISTRIVFMY